MVIINLQIAHFLYRLESMDLEVYTCLILMLWMELL